MRAWWRKQREKPSRAAARDAEEAHARFVYIEDDGSARDLAPDEAAYLATPFEPADGARPYIKARYDARTPDGRLRGFLARDALPPGTAVRAANAPPA